MRIIFCLMVVLASLLSAPSYADDVYTIVVKKQEEKAKHRWSLAEWLETRDKMRLMDLWLALHSPSPYEFFVGGNWAFRDGAGGRVNAWGVEAAAYASIFGLELHRSFSPQEEWLGQFNLRVFGYHAQGTNITLHAGMRSESEPETSRNAYAGGSVSIYLARFFGIEGLARHHFSSIPNSAGYTVSGNHYEGGAFIEFKFLRLYGSYYATEETLTGAVNADHNRTGVHVGTRFYF